MKKRYDLPEESKTGPDQNEDNPYMVNEPAAAPYGIEAETIYSPPLTEEELRDSMTTEEFKAYWIKCIDEIFEK